MTRFTIVILNDNQKQTPITFHLPEGELENVKQWFGRSPEPLKKRMLLQVGNEKPVAPHEIEVVKEESDEVPPEADEGAAAPVAG